MSKRNLPEAKPTKYTYPVVKGYTNAAAVHAALTESYQPMPRAPEIQSIIKLFIAWNEDALDAGKSDMPPSFELIHATDIESIDSANLHNVDYRGRPLSKKRLAELPPFEETQRRRQSESYGSVQITTLDKPFISSNERAHIQSMFPLADFPFADIVRINLRGKRNANFRSVTILEVGNNESMWLTHYLMQSAAKQAA